MRLHELKAFPSDQKKRRRKGRGPGNGLGRYAGKGIKGQKKRAGQSIPPTFEGGQLPFVRRVPKRGFKNPFKVRYNVISLSEVEQKFSQQAEVTLDDLARIKKRGGPYKILADGDLTRPLRIEAHTFSAKAREKIESMGGEAKSVEES